MLSAVNKYPSDAEMSLDSAHMPTTWADTSIPAPRFKPLPSDTEREIAVKLKADALQVDYVSPDAKRIAAIVKPAVAQAFTCGQELERKRDLSKYACGVVTGAMVGAVVMWLLCGAPTGLEPKPMRPTLMVVR